jgi:hypothetical protein
MNVKMDRREADRHGTGLAFAPPGAIAGAQQTASNPERSQACLGPGRLWPQALLTVMSTASVLFILCTGTHSLHAGQIEDLTPLSDFNLEDEILFPPSFFPGIETLPDHLIMLEGLAALYPGKILKELPLESGQEVRPPKIEPLPRGITYARVYHLSGDLSGLIERIDDAPLIIDLRFVDSDLENALAFGRLLGLHMPVRLEARGNYLTPPMQVSDLVIEKTDTPQSRDMPILILTNDGTTGPLEAVLDAVQAQNEIITVGTPTGGHTGRYHEIAVDPPYYVIAGEIRAAGRSSLVHHGFRPEIDVPVDSARDYRAYYAFERGVEISRLINYDLDESDPALNTSPPTTYTTFTDAEGTLPERPKNISSTALADPILQRAVNIIVALQVLRSVPTS